MSVFSLRDDRGPDAAVEFAGHRIVAVRLERRGAAAGVAAHAVVPLAPGALVPALGTANVIARPAVAGALAAALERIGRPARLGVVLADPVARVSLIRFQHVPGRAAELEQLIRWQMKKALPFAVEEAQVTYAPAGRTAEGQEFLVTLARTDVVREYEALCADAGAVPGLVDVSITSVINAVLASTPADGGDRLLVHAAPDSTSLAVLRGATVVLLRNRASDGDGSLADLVHQTAMYYEDRLGGRGFSQVLVSGGMDAGVGEADAALRHDLHERLGVPVRALDASTVSTLHPGALSADVGRALLPTAGLLLRHQRSAA